MGGLRAVPPRRRGERGHLWRCGAGIRVRPTDGLYPLRDHRRVRAAELAGEADERKPDGAAGAVTASILLDRVATILLLLLLFGEQLKN